IGSIIRKSVKYIPLLGPVDSLLGGILGFIEAWLLWLLLLFALGSFLGAIQSGFATGSILFQGINLQGLHISFATFRQWHDFYNQAVTNSLFAKVNGFFVTVLPELPKTPKPLP